MQNFVFNNPIKMIFGPGEINKIGIEAKALGKKAMIVTGKGSSSKYKILDRVLKYLKKEKVEAVVFDKVEPNPRTTTIDTAAQIARENNCDMIIGLGGGSPMDAAKAIAAGAAENIPIWDMIPHGQKAKPLTKALPIIEIPTLAATGSEGNCGGVFTNWETHEKAVLFLPILYPKVSIIDPELTLTVPENYTVDGGVDIICHVMEGFFTGVENTPIQDLFALSIVRTVMDNLLIVIDNPSDINARSQLSWASTIALSGLVNLGRGGSFPLHAMEHALSGYYDISHGRGLAILLPRLMEYSYSSRPEKYAMMTKELFGTDEKSMDEAEMAKASVNGMIQFLKEINCYLKLSDVGIIDDSKFEAMAKDTLRLYSADGKSIYNPKVLYKNDIIKIYQMCMK
ncbi:MAG: iron-containing alcohol dehydrogenase [candidate division Zixibacteria bacterium]|nr:iron-containing alcohol dehydrogenase [candidate division Zixibacteria bacterium]